MDREGLRARVSLVFALSRWTTCGSTGVRATGTRQRNGEAGAASREADADHTWLVGLHFRNANPDTAADLVLRLALAVRPSGKRVAGVGWCPLGL